MLPLDFVFPAMLALLTSAIAIRAVIAIYYRDGERILPLLRLRPTTGRIEYYRPLDTAFAILPFLHCWLEIGAAVLLFRWTDYSVSAGCLLVLVSGGRMRALQEVGHNALHAALCPSKSYQWLLSNLLFQFPIFKRDMQSRFVTHVREHHPNADIPGVDPNLMRVSAAGMRPGISPFGFVVALLYPMLPHGIFNSIQTMLRAAIKENRDRKIVVLRILTCSVVVALFLCLGGWAGFFVGYLIPLVVFYPLFSWWSLLSKHRWHTPYVPNLDKRSHDYEHGRATDFTGIFAPVLRYLIFPMSDAYHLAHHIYPYVRTEYLPAVDRELKVIEPRYTQYISDGFLFGRNGQPAALSDLYQRVVVRADTPTVETSARAA
jgi:fatty acid desaturase